MGRIDLDAPEHALCSETMARLKDEIRVLRGERDAARAATIREVCAWLRGRGLCRTTLDTVAAALEAGALDGEGK